MHALFLIIDNISPLDFIYVLIYYIVIVNPQAHSRVVIMSLTVLSPLCPTVAKVSIVLSCPKQKSPTPSQQGLFSLLRKRRERYLAQRERKKGDELQGPDSSVQSFASLQWEGTDERKHHSLSSPGSNHSSISLPKLHMTTKQMCKKPSRPQTNIGASISLPECGNGVCNSDTSCKQRVGNARQDRNHQNLLRNLGRCA